MTSERDVDPAISRSDHESALGRWRVSAYSAPARSTLAPYLDRIWDFAGTMTHRLERLFPTGRYEIVVQLDAPHRPVEGDLTWSAFPSACVAPLQDGPRVIEAPVGAMRVLGIRLTPLGAYAIFATPPGDFGSDTIDARDAVGGAARELESRLHDAPSGAARVAVARDWLVRRLARANACDPAVAWVAGALDRGSRAPVETLRSRTARGKTSFAATFRRQIGTTPKRFAAMVRVRDALELLASGETSIGDAALRAGYYDQAHMNADFRKYAGLTPGRYLASLHYDRSGSIVELET